MRAPVNSQAYKQHLDWVMTVLFKLEVVVAGCNDSNALTCVPGSKASRGLLGFVSC